MQTDKRGKTLFNFKTETARRLHAIFSCIANRETPLKDVFDTFLDLMIKILCIYGANVSAKELTMWSRSSTSSRVNPTLVSAMQLAIQVCLTGTLTEKSDVLGDYFEHAGFGEKYLGQILTPQDLADMLVAQTLESWEQSIPPEICDPCCGSGRFLLAAGRIAPHASLYGIDIDLYMARMSAINLTLFGMRGMIICGDILDIQPGPLDQCIFRCAYSFGGAATGKLIVVPGNRGHV